MSVFKSLIIIRSVSDTATATTEKYHVFHWLHSSLTLMVSKQKHYKSYYKRSWQLRKIYASIPMALQKKATEINPINVTDAISVNVYPRWLKFISVDGALIVCLNKSFTIKVSKLCNIVPEVWGYSQGLAHLQVGFSVGKSRYNERSSCLFVLYSHKIEFEMLVLDVEHVQRVYISITIHISQKISHPSSSAVSI